MKRIFFIFFILPFSNYLSAQDFNKIFTVDRQINSTDSNKLFLRIENQNFFKNNEYFNVLEDGYTLLGTMLKPQLVFYPSRNSKLEAGVLLLKYSGLEKISQALPIFSFQVNICNGFDVRLGTLYSGYNHQLIEPLYKPELHFMNNYESGLQIMTHKKRFVSDLWLNWEQMLFWGDPFQEQLTVGTSNRIFLTDTASTYKLSIPLQGLVQHKGGQISSMKDFHLQTLANLATGLSFECSVHENYIKSCGVNSYFVTFNDLSPFYKALPYINGYGIYSDVWANTKYLNVFLGYWEGNYYYAPKGEPLFMSISSKNMDVLVPYNKIAFAKFGLKKEIYKNINLELRFESYYTLAESNFDYTYGLHIVFNRDFFLKKF